MKLERDPTTTGHVLDERSYGAEYLVRMDRHLTPEWFRDFELIATPNTKSDSNVVALHATRRTA